jgi:hypothetical protein
MEKINLSSVDKSLVDYDLFICSSSFENRCLEVASKVNSKQFKKVIVCHFKDNYKEAEHNLSQIKGLFNNLSVIELLKNQPLSNYDRLFDEINNSECVNVLLDISTFTREMFLIIIQLFRMPIFANKKLTLCYNPSDKYSSVQKDKLDELWLSKGVDNIRSVLGFSGDFSPIKKLLLIVLVGFEAERSQILIDSFEPNLLFIGKASKKESANEEIAQINELNFQKLLKKNSDAKQFEFSCMDLSFTIKSISQIIETYQKRYNIVISPMCNKLSTLAVASVVFKYPEVQICYASTNLYNIDAYSTPSNYIYMIDANELESMNGNPHEK